MSPGHLHTVNKEVEPCLVTLTAQKGVQVIVPERTFKSCT